MVSPRCNASLDSPGTQYTASSLSQKGALEAVDARGGLHEWGLRVVPDVHRESGPHSVLRRLPSALQVAAFQRDLGFGPVVQRMAGLPEDLARGAPEVHDV